MFLAQESQSSKSTRSVRTLSDDRQFPLDAWILREVDNVFWLDEINDRAASAASKSQGESDMGESELNMGVKAKSNACGIAVSALRTFRIVWWRASTVRIEPAAVRRTGPVRRWTAPRYAVTPTFSTRRATPAMVVMSVRTLEKSNEQVVTGVPPRALMPAWEKETSESDQTEVTRQEFANALQARLSG